MSSLEKINSFIANGKDNNNNGRNYNSILDSSLNNTKTLIEDLLRDEDNKFIKQLDDLRHCTLAR